MRVDVDCPRSGCVECRNIAEQYTFETFIRDSLTNDSVVRDTASKIAELCEYHLSWSASLAMFALWHRPQHSHTSYNPTRKLVSFPTLSKRA